MTEVFPAADSNASTVRYPRRHQPRGIVRQHKTIDLGSNLATLDILRRHTAGGEYHFGGSAPKSLRHWPTPTAERPLEALQCTHIPSPRRFYILLTSEVIHRRDFPGKQPLAL